jgi:predicted AAA+ superfamily ATPase
MAYQARVMDELLADRLRSAGAVLIEGPKASGKTLTARRAAASEVLLDVDANAVAALAVDPALVLAGKTPRLLDEWQFGADVLWNHVRRLVDDRQAPGQFILTGSAVPADDVRRHTGAGRFAVLRMRPMSLAESGHSSRQISLAQLLLHHEVPSCPDPGLSVADIAELVTIGGWPANLQRSRRAAAQANRDYLTQVREVDVSRVGNVRRDPRRIDRFLQSLARHTATEAKIAVLSEDAGEPGEAPLARTTAYEYLDVLTRLMLLEDQPAWSTHLRSRATLRQAPKRHFVDPSLAVAALRASPERLLADLNTLGYLFESMVVRDLRVLVQPLDGTVHHYRDSDGLEIDAVVALPTGQWGAFEVKLGAGQIDAAARSLRAFAAKLDTTRCGSPAVLGVITVASYGFLRADGVAVLPVAALAP